MHILHRRLGTENNFRNLGVTFDTKLTMAEAAAEISREGGWRVSALLKPRRFFKLDELMRLYKSQVLSYLENATPAIYHAADSHLDLIDRVQRRFLREVGLSESDALEHFCLAPLSSRRCMAMLAVLHRITLNIAPPQLCNLFPCANVPVRSARTRLESLRHSKQFLERRASTDVFQRSLFGLVRVYNMLPQSVVDVPSVRIFQGLLQDGLRRAAQAHISKWPDLFSPNAPPVDAHELQRLLKSRC